MNRSCPDLETPKNQAPINNPADQRLTWLEQRSMKHCQPKSHSTLPPRRFPLLIIPLHLLLTIPARIHLAARKPDQEIIILVHMAPLLAWRKLIVSVHDALRDESEFGQDSGVPLHNVFLNTNIPSALLSTPRGWYLGLRASSNIPERDPPPSENYTSDTADRTSYPERSAPNPPAARQNSPGTAPPCPASGSGRSCRPSDG